VSLYVLDSHSTRAAAQIKGATLPILLTSLGELELSNALFLRRFRKELPAFKVKAAYAMFRRDIADGLYHWKPLSGDTFETARQIAERRTPQLGARTLDILHVASALILDADSFYTFDRIQAQLAKAEGLTLP
jgi:predicted nucleic acid-binding protein